MRCKNCGAEIADRWKFCVHCGTKLDPVSPVDDELAIELPELKTTMEEPILIEDEPILVEVEEPEVLTEENETITNITIPEKENNTLVDDNLKLEDLNQNKENISNQEETNNEEINNIDIQTDNSPEDAENKYNNSTTENNENIDEETEEDETPKKRKKSLILALLFLAIIGAILFVLLSKTPKQEEKYIDYSSSLSEALTKFWSDGNTTKLDEILDDVKDNTSTLLDLQNQTKEKAKEWISDVKQLEAEDEKYDTSISEAKNRLKKLYEINAKGKNGEVKFLTPNEYKTLLSELDNVQGESRNYTEALNYYKDKSYNESYSLFEQVEEKNAYYNKAQTYLSSIKGEIMSSLRADITKIESGIDTLSNSQKLTRYTQIEEIIRAYNDLYNNLHLDSDTEYKALLDDYSSKVKTYKRMVYNSQITTTKKEPVEQTEQPEVAEEIPVENVEESNVVE